MDDSPELIQSCLLCVDVPQPDCIFCFPLPDHDWQHTQPYHNDLFSYGDLQSAELSLDDAELPFHFSADSELSHTASLELTQIGFGANLEVQLPGAVGTQPAATIPLTRRRNWTVEENRDFEDWITTNSNPTRQQKQDFADKHDLLTAAQVQSKINNWRNGRNPRRKQSMHRNEGSLEASKDMVQGIDQSIGGDTVEGKYGQSILCYHFANTK